MPSPTLGIDLGTSFCCVAVMQHGEVQLLCDKEGTVHFPSIVAVSDSGCLLGNDAKTHAELNPMSCVYDTKRLLGRSLSDPFVQANLPCWPFSISEVEGKLQLQAADQSFTVEEVTTKLLAHLKAVAEKRLEQELANAVVSVPACFSLAQRQVVKNAAAQAGLNVVRMITDTAAAALTHVMAERISEVAPVLIFKIGGGFTEATIATFEDGVVEMKSSESNANIGGIDFDSRLVNHCVQEFKRKHSKDITGDKHAMFLLRSKCEQAKIWLTSQKEFEIDIDSLFEGIYFHLTITRTCFEDLNIDLFENAKQTAIIALNNAKLNKNQIKDIILTGGSVLIPKIQNLLKEYFERKDLHVSLAPQGDTLYGCAVQAAISTASVHSTLRTILFIDITTNSLGIETFGGKMTTLLKKNRTIPVVHTQTFTTQYDDQTGVIIKVFEGENEMTKDNKLVGILELTGILKASKQVPQIEITLDLDQDYMLTVTAVETSTKKTSTLTVTDPVTVQMSGVNADKGLAEICTLDWPLAIPHDSCNGHLITPNSAIDTSAIVDMIH